METLVGYIQTTEHQIMFRVYQNYVGRYNDYCRLEDTIVLTQVENNYGGGFDKDTGKFIVPKSGNYTFWMEKTGYTNNKTARVDLSLSATVNGTVVNSIGQFKTNMFSDYSGYSFEIVTNFDFTWNMTLSKFDIVSITTANKLAIGRSSKMDKITWSGFLSAPINDSV